MFRLLRRLFDYSHRQHVVQQRADAYAAFRAALNAGDTRRQAVTWPALAKATHQQLAAEIGRAPAQWRGR